MQVAICIADAASTDSKGTVSAMGLGATQLKVASVPASFNGVLVIILTPDEQDLQGQSHDADIELIAPGEVKEAFARAQFIIGAPRDQAVSLLPFGLNVNRYGEYIFRLKTATVKAETHLVVVQNQGSAAPVAREVP